MLCMKAGSWCVRKGKVSALDMETLMMADGVPLAERTEKKKAVPNVKSTRNIKSCKVMLDLDRIRAVYRRAGDTDSLEFTHHLHALACLRELNNNATYCDMAGASGGMDDEVKKAGKKSAKPKLIVEFALENMRKVKILKERSSQMKRKAEASEEYGKGSMKKSKKMHMKKRKWVSIKWLKSADQMDREGDDAIRSGGTFLEPDGSTRTYKRVDFS